MKVFPFNSDTYLAIGTAVWRKEERNADDNALVAVAADWTAVHLPGWQKVRFYKHGSAITAGVILLNLVFSFGCVAISACVPVVRVMGAS